MLSKLLVLLFFYSIVSGQTIKLSPPSFKSKTSIEEAMKERRSNRNFQPAALKLSEVSQLLWAVQGTNRSNGRRTAPSAGALYPLEVYLITGNISGLDEGVYKYKSTSHSLKKVMDKNILPELNNAVQNYASRGAIALVICAVYERTTIKYGDRGIRYVHMDVGFAAQNVYLQCVSLGLGTVFMGAFDDDALSNILELPNNIKPLGIMPVGKAVNTN